MVLERSEERYCWCLLLSVLDCRGTSLLPYSLSLCLSCFWPGWVSVLACTSANVVVVGLLVFMVTWLHQQVVAELRGSIAIAVQRGNAICRLSRYGLLCVISCERCGIIDATELMLVLLVMCLLYFIS